MSNGVAFQTRARTIDHLGRGQIADAPTAISELWKNAYDAYARNVALHIFDGEPNVAAIVDDGIGMSLEDVIQRWLVVGTESKIEDFESQPPDTLGLPPRPRQGEKGIGRLSVAFLAPATILLSKRSDSKFVAVLVDWRLFENPFLALEDIRLPIEEYESPDALAEGLPALVDTIHENFGGGNSERGKTLEAGWKRFSEYERRNGVKRPTADAIVASWKKMPLTRRHLEEWPTFLELSDHGTAMYAVDLNHELGVWVRPSEAGEEVEEIKSKLRSTLTSFVDPYSENRPVFDYEVYTHIGQRDVRILSATDMFGYDDLRELEHYVDGTFDERGTFTGKIVAFGQDLGTRTFTPAKPLTKRGRDPLGPFQFTIGTFEVDERRSTHEALQHADLKAKAEKFAGIGIYRDFLRVMPYGRPDSDFLELEQRRGYHAGREFWAHRRSFGRIGFTRTANPALRDKAGREGLVDNRAFREMRLIVIEFLMDAARKYFGTDAPLREELMPGIMERKALQKEAADKARKRRRKGMREFLRSQSGPLDDALKRAESLIALAKDTLSSKDKTQATVLAARAQELKVVEPGLRPPIPPSRLGDLEERWRSYRDEYQLFLDRLKDLADVTDQVQASVKGDTPKAVLEERFNENSNLLKEQLHSFEEKIEAHLKELRKNWEAKASKDRNALAERTGHLLQANIDSANLIGMLNLIDANRLELSENFVAEYQPFVNTLEQLIEGIDIEGAYAITEDTRAELEEQLNDIHAVAQIGITVEIIGHEFESLESEVRRNLSKLPDLARETTAYKNALLAHNALADRLRFLSPLKIGGYRARERITGAQIGDFVEEFFDETFKERRIDFVATKAFREISITDIPARIYPAFLNLVNNSVYWTSQSEKREIRLDFQEGLAIVADTGPGVDPDDVDRIFDIFFTRRRSGRGVGLYLTKINMGVAGHKIRYATVEDPKILSGANFIIEFKGVHKTNG